MENENLIRNVFFNSYKAFMDYLMVISNRPNEYKILVSTQDVNDVDSKLKIIIRKEDFSNKKDNSIVYANTIVMHKQNIEYLIDHITEDFINNHFVNYACVNERDMTQTIQNSRFRLVFKLNNPLDLFNAEVVNRRINTEKENNNYRKVRELIK